MVENSDDPKILDRIRSRAHASKNHSPGPRNQRLRSDQAVDDPEKSNNAGTLAAGRTSGVSCHDGMSYAKPKSEGIADETSSTSPDHAPPPASENRPGATSSAIELELKPNWAVRFYHTLKEIMFSSIINVLLVFVPVGIAVKFAGVNPTIVFAMNAVAIIPLAGLLSHATESVANSMGDTVGALMNVTFGNAVELIIFIALVNNEIRIVQASLLGSILANLLLILGMCFLFGGLLFREQIYNSTVTQMSACLLSLSVMSLLLPTAFHASFTDNGLADLAVLKVSRGSSIILLLVYVLYLLFQLKSHAFLYKSTPQHVIDEESHPGLLADMLGSSSSSDTSGSSNDSDTDESSGSHTTAKRIRRAFRGRRRRKSSASSKETPSLPSAIRTPSVGTFSPRPDLGDGQLTHSPTETVNRHPLGAIASGDEADSENDGKARKKTGATMFRDFENEKNPSGTTSPVFKSRRKSRRKNQKASKLPEEQAELREKSTFSAKPKSPREDSTTEKPESPRVSFVQDVQTSQDDSQKRPYNLRGLSLRSTIPTMPTTVFSAHYPADLAANTSAQPLAVPRAPYGLRRASSLPDRLNNAPAASSTQPPVNHAAATAAGVSLEAGDRKVKKYISRTSAVILLLASTALVAVCANFLVESINYLVSHTNVSEAFIGLIILPIVGNAAEHVTAVTVASKNKMDLAIGVAVGSSIQIALFVTPIIVLLGWILAKDMSLYFSLFETISLFVSVFVVNFLVLDGRSNYLEGALLIAAYVIIAVAAFFYPDSSEQSVIGGAAQEAVKMF